MKYIETGSHNPYYNIATEEYFLKNSNENILLLYVNQPSVIVGKHQNIYREVNFPFIHKNEISLVRRLSGGGTVYHDKGNLNFTFITNEQKGKMVDFKRYLLPIKSALEDLGIRIDINERNNLLIKGKKISGNAEHIFKTRVLHHGTLLLETDLSVLEKTIQQRTRAFRDKSIESVRSKVTNINEHLSGSLSVEELKTHLLDFFRGKNILTSSGNLEKQQKEEINKLIKDKYSLWEWNFGYSPKFEMSFSHSFEGEELDITIQVEKAIIKSCKVNTNCNPKINQVFDMLVEEKMNYDSLIRRISEVIDSNEAEKLVYKIM